MSVKLVYNRQPLLALAAVAVFMSMAPRAAFAAYYTGGQYQSNQSRALLDTEMRLENGGQDSGVQQAVPQIDERFDDRPIERTQAIRTTRIETVRTVSDRRWEISIRPFDVLLGSLGLEASRAVTDRASLGASFVSLNAKGVYETNVSGLQGGLFARFFQKSFDENGFILTGRLEFIDTERFSKDYDRVFEKSRGTQLSALPGYQASLPKLPGRAMSTFNLGLSYFTGKNKYEYSRGTIEEYDVQQLSLQAELLIGWRF
jgi:hypothetical protein